MRLPQKNIYKWYVENFGIGGAENYMPYQFTEITEAIEKLLRECG